MHPCVANPDHDSPASHPQQRSSGKGWAILVRGAPKRQRRSPRCAMQRRAKEAFVFVPHTQTRLLRMLAGGRRPFQPERCGRLCRAACGVGRATVNESGTTQAARPANCDLSSSEQESMRQHETRRGGTGTMEMCGRPAGCGCLPPQPSSTAESHDWQ